MPSRVTIARLSTVAVLCAVLVVVLQQANSHPDLYGSISSQGAFGAPASATTDTVVSVPPLVSSAKIDYYICHCGGCVSSDDAATTVPIGGEWGTPMANACPANCPDSTQWPAVCNPPPPSSMTSSCNAPGAVCGGGYGDCCAPATCDNVSDYGYCVLPLSSYSSSAGTCSDDSDCPMAGDDPAHIYCCDGTCVSGGCSSSMASSDDSKWCCVSGSCTQYNPCGAVGAACGAVGQPGCCSGSFCDTDGTCTPGTPE